MKFFDAILLVPILAFSIIFFPIGYIAWFVYKGLLAGFNAGEKQSDRMYWASRPWERNSPDVPSDEVKK